MADQASTEQAPPRASRLPGGLAGSCLLALGIAGVTSLGTAGAGWYWYLGEQAAAAATRKDEAEAEFQPAYRQLDEAIASSGPVDIDKTVRVIHELDEAMQASSDGGANLQDFLTTMATQDYRGVAPEVLSARRELLSVMFELQSRQVELEDQRAAWNYTTDVVLGTLSLVNVGGAVESTGGVPTGGTGHFSVDRVQAEHLLRKAEEERAMRARLQRDVHDLQGRLLDATMKWSGTWFGYVEQWDRLCLQRDRAYLAAHDGDWEEAAIAAREAITAAPGEREAHLLLALARIEGARPAPEGGPIDDADIGAFLDAIVAAHPDSAAPALQLKGVWLAREGRADAARLAFQLAATAYPAQSATLARLANPYRYRTDLRKTREGTYISKMYQTTQLGAGYFSPDLQMARAYYDQGNATEGKKKLLDHFYRRRNQAQWGLILDDIQFCEQFFGPHFAQIFPEESFLDLTVAPGLFGEKLKLGVTNRSDRTVHNATLLLCLHLTDQHPDDYEVLRVDPTAAAVQAHEETAFADTEVHIAIFGQEKGITDIVTNRAILIADEGVMWVDTDEYKIAEAEAFRLHRARSGAGRQAAPGPSDGTARRAVGAAVEQALSAVHANAHLQVKQALIGPDDVIITLPRAVVLLAPTFRLKLGEDPPLPPDDSTLDGDTVVLTWNRVHSWETSGGASPPAVLSVGSPFAAVRVEWQGDASATYVLSAPPTLE
ncbi:MAG: hypothetical protein EXR69_06875 [Myxococcales bacterium]|nr:hypothetical protein [Myxococcales bacterium]